MRARTAGAFSPMPPCEDERVQSTERGGDAAAVLPIPGRVGESQIRIGQAAAVNLPIQRSLQRFAGLIQRELDARRAPIDRQDAALIWFYYSHDSRSGPNHG